MKGWSGFEKFAVGLVVILVLGVVGWYGSKAIEGSSAATITPNGTNYIFVSNEGKDTNDGSVRFPLRTLRQAASRAQSASGSVVTIGLLGDAYTLPTTDLDWGGGGVLSFTAKKQINLTGFKRDDSATSTGGVVENRTVVGIQGLGGPLSISARDTSVLVRGLEFDMAVSPMLNFDAMRGSKVALSDNTFTREKTQPATGELVVFESFENGIGIVNGNKFYFRGFAGNVVEHVALNIQNNGTARQQVVGNKFYYPLITQFNNSAGSVLMPFVGVKMWGSYMDVVGNSFAIDADRFAGQTPTSASRMIAGLRVMFGDNNKITDNSFAGFWGTPMVIETPIKSPLPDSRQGIAIDRNQS